VVVPLPVQPVSASGAVVLFGKLPSHGDFVSRGLDARARAAVDGWLSQAVAMADERLQDGFASAHDLAPVWRFVAEDEILGPGWAAGALSPSVARAGRRFFILVAVTGLTSDDAGARGRRYAEVVESMIYETFSLGWDADGLLHAAARAVEAASAETPAPPAIQPWWIESADGGPAWQSMGRPIDLLLSAQTAGSTEVMA
jgi:type VI secretion system protein ImpM